MNLCVICGDTAIFRGQVDGIMTSLCSAHFNELHDYLGRQQKHVDYVISAARIKAAVIRGDDDKAIRALSTEWLNAEILARDMVAAWLEDPSVAGTINAVEDFLNE